MEYFIQFIDNSFKKELSETDVTIIDSVTEEELSKPRKNDHRRKKCLQIWIPRWNDDARLCRLAFPLQR